MNILESIEMNIAICMSLCQLVCVMSSRVRDLNTEKLQCRGGSSGKRPSTQVFSVIYYEFIIIKKVEGYTIQIYKDIVLITFHS